ncbi:sensor histidine kinase [Georgenia sp. MJ170]|uniref:sensor histidine kinase n=1 Tax=Georgenia sunbinii TaxID=3117728 RepID=UPI002F263B6E
MSAPARAWTLRNRLRTGLLVSGTALGLVLVLAAIALGQVTRYQEEVTASIFETVIVLERLERDVLAADTAVRDFAVTGDEAFLAPYEAVGPDRLAELHHRAEQQLPGADGLAGAIDELASAITGWREQRAEPLIDRTRQLGAAADTGVAVPVAAGHLGEVRQAAAVTLDELLDHREVVSAQLRMWRTSLGFAVAAIAVAAVAIGTGLWFYLRRWVTDPLDRLAEASRAVSEGDLEREVHVTGPHEVVSLATDVEQMRRRLVSQLDQVETARVELEASNRDLEQFAYVASHDLQEPLRKVASFTQLLQRRYGDQLDERAEQYIEFAADGARRMQRLIQDLLAFSRLGRGGQEPEPVALEDCLAAALDNLQDAVEESAATVTVEGAVPTVLGHPVALTQLLQNLVGNAIKFRQPGRPPVVTIGARRVGAEWVLWCTDNGIGVEPRHADRVFAIFQRLHAKDAYPGTGIGLAMCQRIVELHGGKIWIEERPDVAGTGTTVRWTLPVHDDIPAEERSSTGAVGHNDDSEPTEVSHEHDD